MEFAPSLAAVWMTFVHARSESISVLTVRRRQDRNPLSGSSREGMDKLAKRKEPLNPVQARSGIEFPPVSQPDPIEIAPSSVYPRGKAIPFRR